MTGLKPDTHWNRAKPKESWDADFRFRRNQPFVAQDRNAETVTQGRRSPFLIDLLQCSMSGYQ
jgi:hypothetical protein